MAAELLDEQYHQSSFMSPQLSERDIYAKYKFSDEATLTLFGYFNDLAMRTSLPALFLLSFYCAHCLADNWPERQKAMPRGPLAALVIVLCAGAVTPLFEISRVLNFDDGERRRYEQLDYTTLSTVHRFFRGQYTARNIPDWYRGLMKNGKDRDDDG